MSSMGSDSHNCSSIHSPCLNIDHAVNISTSDNLHIILKYHSGNTYYIPCTSLNLTLHHWLKISGNQARIGCERPESTIENPRKLNSQLSVKGIHNVSSLISLEDLVFVNADISLIDTHVFIRNCRFQSSRLRMLNEKSGITDTKGLVIEYTQWSGYTYCQGDNCAPSGEVFIRGHYNAVNITGNIFSNTNLTVDLLSDSNVKLAANHLTNDRLQRPVESHIFIQLDIMANRSQICVEDSVFEHQYHWNPVESVMNIYESALLLRYISPQTVMVPNNISVIIENCTFYNNERGLTFQGQFEHIRIRNCTFSSNVAMHAGAGILLLTMKHAFIENSTFEHNAAGRYRKDKNVRSPGDYFKVDNDEAYVYSNCCKGSISLIGKGGAIRVQKGHVTLIGCEFINNTATILGGSIFVDRDCRLIIEDTKFTNGDSIRLAAQQGDMLYSNGQVKINRAKLSVQSAANHISLLQHSGEHWSIGIYDITIDCPIGYRLRIMNTSAYRVVPLEGLERSYMLDQLAYFCESCARYKYSLERGFFKYKMDAGASGYFTLMINGENPNSEFQGTYEYRDIVCKKCPYGGNCDDDQLKSLPNFWGYEHHSEVKFQLCPKGYCCNSKVCPSYNNCAKYRTGRLCAECQEGYSEALFSSKCIPNSLCGPVWIWVFSFGMGFLYAMLLFFQKDIRDFIFAMPKLNCQGGVEESVTEDKNLEEQQHCLTAETNQFNSFSNSTEKPAFTGTTDILVIDDNQHKNGISRNKGAEVVESYGQILLSPDKTAGSNDEEDGCCQEDEQSEEENKASQAATDFGAIMLITILYYFQDAQLLHVKTAFAVEENPKWSLIKAILLGLFKFRIEIAHFVDSVCLIEGMSASVKLLARTLLVPYVLLLFGVLYLAYMLFSKLCQHKTQKSKDESEPEKTFLSRLAMGFMLALLFTYQMLATTAFKLLNCVPVGDHSVLFIDATVTCYEGWQYGVLAYAMSCIVLFSFVLMLGPGLLHEGRISLPTFFTACIFPFPFVISWILIRLCKKSDLCLPKNESFPTGPGQVVIKVLQGPFKDISSPLTGPVCWAGVLIFRRLLLVLLYTFINVSLLRILAMLLTCFIILLNQVHVKPYRDSRANIAGSASVAALMFVGGINLVRAGFEAAEYTPHGPYEMLILVMQETENVLMLWIPLVFMVVMGTILMIKICCRILISVRKCCFGDK